MPFCDSLSPEFLRPGRNATWLHKARELPKEEIKPEVSKHLTGKGTEPWEILYFKA